MDNFDSVDEIFDFFDKINDHQREFLNENYKAKINSSVNTGLEKKFGFSKEQKHSSNPD